MKKLTIIIPAHNEERHIVANLFNVEKAIEGLDRQVQVIVVDDGSLDHTFEYAKRFYGNEPNFSFIKLVPNRGKGAAIRAGLGNATGYLIAFIDADMDIAPQQIRLLLDVMETESAAVVIGSKLHRCSVVHYPVIRKVLSLGYFVFIKILFGLSCRDTQTGLKLFRAGALKTVVFEADDFMYDLQILVKLHKLGYKIAEAPVVLDYQDKYLNPKANIGPRIVWRMFRDTIKFWISERKNV